MNYRNYRITVTEITEDQNELVVYRNSVMDIQDDRDSGAAPDGEVVTILDLIEDMEQKCERFED